MESLEEAIMEVVARVGDPTLDDILTQVDEAWFPADVKSTVMAFVHRGWLRMKDDDQEHDRTYRVTAKGREAYAHIFA